MNANNTTTYANAESTRRDEMIALAREIRSEFAKIHSLMAKTLDGSALKKAA